jgi:hypothetical protein
LLFLAVAEVSCDADDAELEFKEFVFAVEEGLCSTPIEAAVVTWRFLGTVVGLLLLCEERLLGRILSFFVVGCLWGLFDRLLDILLQLLPDRTLDTGCGAFRDRLLDDLLRLLLGGVPEAPCGGLFDRLRDELTHLLFD